MGLLTKEVEMTVTGISIKKYAHLGYNIPKKANGKYNLGDKFMVSVSDLSINSAKKVHCLCDECGHDLIMNFESYNKNKRNNKIYCYHCAIKLFNTKANHPKWNKNLTDEDRQNGRNMDGYDDFIKMVLKRDNYSCQCCKSKHNISVHHLDGYNWCIEKRTDVTNGITLCDVCHKNFHSKYGYGNNTKQQFDKWIGYILDNNKMYDMLIAPAKQVYCIEEDKIYKSPNKLAKEWNVAKFLIYKMCNRAETPERVLQIKGKHLIWYDIYKTLNNNELKQYMTWFNGKVKEKVIAFPSMQIFDSMTIASNYYDISVKRISKVCCLNHTKIVEPEINLTKISICKNKNLTFMKLYDFERLSENSVQTIIHILDKRRIKNKNEIYQ